MTADAGVLRDNHLLITGHWQGLTRLIDSQILIVLAICHLIGCPAPEPPYPLRASGVGKAGLLLWAMENIRYSLVQLPWQQTREGAWPVGCICPGCRTFDQRHKETVESRMLSEVGSSSSTYMPMAEPRSGLKSQRFCGFPISLLLNLCSA